ncbi:MAG: hypothetical protein KJO63_05690, partial [Maribacter sp.]|nr:hypothetical protein [Maribacter sp.]
LTTDDKEKQKQGESGGLTMDATGAENHCTLLVIEPSPVEKDMLWAGSDDGRVHYSQNGGSNWVEVTQNIKGLPSGSWIAQIKASNKNKGEALLIANDYRRFNYTPYAYRTKNYGKSWERIVDGNDVESYTLSIIEDPKNPRLMFLGTDDGLYITFNAGVKWQKWTEGFPTVSTKDLVIHPREHDLVIGTFGRAAWVLDDIRPLRALAADQTLLQKDIEIFSPPIAYQASYQQPTGSRFGGDALYNAENKKYGAMITYYIKEGKKKTPDKEEEKDKAEADTKKEGETSNDDGAKEKLTGVQKKDSVMFQFYNGDKLIRTIKKKTPEKAGFHRIYWGMDEKGPDRPSRKISKSKNERGGIDVKPGTYKIKASFGDKSAETMIEVKSDPRLNTSMASINEVYEISKKINALTQTAADAVKQLVESKNVANKYQKELKDLDKEKFKDQIKASKDIIKEIDSVIALYLGKEDKRQGITRNPEVTVMQRIRNASYYSGTRKTGITATEERLIKFAKDDLNKALQKTNAFYQDSWKAYRDEIEKQEVSPFKEIKTFDLN